MATGNFHSMADFPLIVAEEMFVKVCPDCGVANERGADKCECGCDLSCVDEEYDQLAMEGIVSDMERVADELNAAQQFYDVSVKSGYYSGVQFYVEEKYGDVTTYDNEGAQYEFGVCRSEMLRRFKVAGNKVRRGLLKAKKELGLDEIVCYARFSNGECVYRKVA